jgi:EAL domain-containing protein (putative c-di-GMP-specific phosphodiesterase class I)/GGDEF domain-containing protein
MIFPALPGNETDRVAALHRFELLDTPSEPFFDQIVRIAAKLFNVPIALVSLIAEDRQWAKAKVGIGSAEIRREDSFCAHAISEQNLLIVEDASVDPRFSLNPLVAGDDGIRFYAGAPLRTRDGYALGTLCVLDRRPRGPLTVEEEKALLDMSALVMAHIEARHQVGYLSPVTGLSNRFRFIDDLNAFIAENSAVPYDISVLMVACSTPQEYADLARALGHTYADTFETEAAQRIRRAIPAKTKLYHVATGRFCCVLSDMTPADIEQLASSLADKLNQPLVCREIPVNATVNIGLAHYPADGATGDELLQAVTGATQLAQAQRRPWAEYLAADDLRWKRGFKLLVDVPAALEASDQFHLHFQPKTDLRTGHCVGAEALLRWEHPDLGSVPPGEFIPLIERTALMQPVTKWVLETAFRQVANWHEEGFAIPVSINVSVLDMEAENFPSVLVELLERYGVHPEWINLEVTESGLMHNQTQVSQQLHAIRSLGIDIEIDDFGTGQSALSYLKHIPASVVKIDQTFIRQLDSEAKDRQIVGATIALAHSLGCRVTAEGIESEAVLTWLMEQGCDVGQGYFMSRPLSAAAFRQWAEERNRKASR